MPSGAAKTAHHHIEIGLYAADPKEEEESESMCDIFLSPCFVMPLRFAHGLVGRARIRTFRANEERQSYGRTNESVVECVLHMLQVPFESKGGNLLLQQ